MIHLLGKVNTRIDKYSKNEVGSDYVCGDIHGIFSVVIEKLEAINFNFETDRLFCTGDLIDRGPESHMVLEFLSAPWIFPVLGNHEQMIIDGEESVWNGAGWWRDIEQDEKDKIRKKFKTLPLAIELETDKGLIGILHAECPTNDWAEFEDLLAKDHRHTYNCIWGRRKFYQNSHSIVDNITEIYVGHSVVDNVLRLGNTTFIDTGAVFNTDKLTIIKL